MAKSNFLQDKLNLVHNLVSESKEDKSKLRELLSTLKKSDLHPLSGQFLKTDSHDLIAKNIEGNNLLREFSQVVLPKSDNKQLVVRREVPSSIFDSLASVSSQNNFFSLNAAAKPSKTLGPFVANDGRQHWFDFFSYEKLVPIYLSGESYPLMLLPLKLIRFIASPSNDYKLAKGSVWIRANLFSKQADATDFTGFKISASKLSISEKVGLLNDRITISLNTVLKLDLVLDNTFVETSDSKYGIDAKNSKVNTPGSLSLSYASKKIRLSSVSVANLELYGDNRTFTYSNGLAEYNSDLSKIFIPFIPSNSEFIIKDVKSPFLDVSGSSKILGAGWMLSLSKLDVSKPFSIRNNGAIGIVTSKGLTCSWQGIDHRFPVHLIRPLFLAEPGAFVVFDAKANLKGIEETYKLWDKDQDSHIKTSLSLSFPGEKKFYYTCVEKGIEGFSTTTDASFETDRPIRADGIPVAPKTKDSIYLKYISDESAKIGIIDADMLTENISQPTEELFNESRFLEIKKLERYHQFGLENAYLLTTAPATLSLNGDYSSENILVTGILKIIYGLIDLIPTLPHPYTSETLNKNLKRASSYPTASLYNNSLLGSVTSICDWKQDNESDLSLVNVDFSLSYAKTQYLPGAYNDSATKSKESISAVGLFNDQESGLSQYGSRQNNSRFLRESKIFSLLDLSTNYDLLGISMAFNQVRVIGESYAKVLQVSEQVVTIQNMNLRTPMAMLNGFMLPQVSWEPFINLGINGQVLPGELDKGVFSFTDQGPATVFTQLDRNMIDIDPLKYIDRFRENLKPEGNYSKGGYDPITNDPSLNSSILFGLPNGKVSIARLSLFNAEQATMNNRHLDFIKPNFSDKKFTGGIQFRVSANMANDPKSFPPELYGATVQMRNLLDQHSNDVSEAILGDDVQQIFNSTFGENFGKTGVPLTHIDFSGYGASTFSNWLAPLAKFADIAQVKFDVLRGRVSHEVVQAVSMIYPYGICVVRTITFYRRNNSIIYREDSGWVAKSDGIFDFSFIGKDAADNPKNFKNPYTFHPGLIGGFYDVHNIKEELTDKITINYTPSNGDYFKNSADDYIHDVGNGNPQKARFVGVTFDANVHIDVNADQKFKNKTGRQFKGYLQLLPQGVPIPNEVFANMMKMRQNSLGGNVDCVVNLGGSKQTILVNRVDISASFQQDTAEDIIFVAAARGSVQLPADGSWSVVELDKASGNVTQIANKQSVPVIRKGERNRINPQFELTNADSVSKIAFADALLNTEATFSKRFGYIQNTSTQKLLLGDPSYDANNPEQLISEAPLLADSFRLLNSKGPFPNLTNAIQIEDVEKSFTNIIDKGLSKAIKQFKLPDEVTFDVIGKVDDAFRMYIQYKSETKDGQKTNTLVDYITDSSLAENWKSELGNMSIVVDLASFKSLMTISGDFKAKVSANANFDSSAAKAPQLKLAEPLEKIYQILEFLDNLDPTQPVEAVKKGLKIAMSNNADSWDYKFKASKEIPFVKFPFDPINYNSPTTPLKLDASFKIGCYFNQPIKIPNTIDELMPSAGAFLELGADLRVMCVSLAAATVYATGRAEVGLAADLKHPPTLYFKFGFGIELCVGLPVIGSVAVLYMVGVDMSLNSENLVVGAFIYFRGRVEIFGGIVTVTIQIEAAGKIDKPLGGGPTSCIAMCTFALDISIFWVIDINFSETWEETRQIA